MDFNKMFEKMQLADEGIKSFYELHKRCESKSFCDKLAMSNILFRRGDDVFLPFLEAFAAEEGVPVEIMNLYIFLRKGEDLLAEFIEKGYGEEVFYDSMRAISTACRYYREANGIYGISPTHRVWFRRLFACGMFRLGRFEFEPIVSQYDAELESTQIKRGDLCVTVHIPRYESFTEEVCEDSYRLAREFFKKHFGIEHLFIFCTSWLIHPWISECLGENSRIAAFQKKYKLLKTTEEPDIVVSWVFGKEMENIDDYPENTSMQRIVKERLKKGLPLGVGAGIRL